jgi:hypothetical protein
VNPATSVKRRAAGALYLDQRRAPDRGDVMAADIAFD